MNLENYLISILKNDLKDYDSYVVGESVLRYILGKPIEEYVVITSAPLFSCSNSKKVSSAKVEIDKYPKRIILFLHTTKEEYLKRCHFSYETLLYHLDKGIIDSLGAILDIQKKILRSIELNFDVYQAERILYLKEYLVFQLAEPIRSKIVSSSFLESRVDKKIFFKEVKKILLLDSVGDLFLEYENFFRKYLPISNKVILLMRYTKSDFLLRLLALLWDTARRDLSQFFLDYGLSDTYYEIVQKIVEMKNFELKEENAKMIY